MWVGVVGRCWNRRVVVAGVVAGVVGIGVQLSMIILLSRRQNVWKVEDTMGCHPFYNISLSSFEYT